MTALLVALFATLRSTVRPRPDLRLEILAHRHQLAVLQRQAPRRPRLRRADRLLRVLLSRPWPNWRPAVQIVTPDTVVRWHRRGFALSWQWRSRPRRAGRPAVGADIRALIRQMQAANPLWGAPRIHCELQKLGIEISQATVAKHVRRSTKPLSQNWRTFLRNHAAQLASIDFFTVPTATFRILFVLVMLSHDRRRIVHVNVTAHPTAEWTAQQMREAWPDDEAPAYLVRDRDGIYGWVVRGTLQGMDIKEVVTAPHSPWQKGRVERGHGTHQDHLVKKMRRPGIADYEAANAFLTSPYIPDHNRRFAQPPAAPEDFHTPVPPGLDLDEVFRLETERTVGHDWVVRHDNRLLQLERRGRHYPPARSTVRVCEYEDGHLDVWYRGQRVPWTDVARRPVTAAPPLASRAITGLPRPPAADHPWRRPYRELPDGRPRHEEIPTRHRARRPAEAAACAGPAVGWGACSAAST